MRNFRYFSPSDQDRLRFADKLRFLIHGRAYKRRFAARAAELGIVFSSREPSHPLLFAATICAMLVAMLAAVGSLGAQLHEARIRNRSLAAELRVLRLRNGQPQASQPLPQTALPQTPQPAPEVQMVRWNPDEGLSAGARQERRDLKQALYDLEQARAGSFDLGEQLRHTREQVDSLRSEIASSKTVEARLSDQLRESELRLTGMTSELARLQTGHAADTELIASQRFSMRELTDRLNTETDTLDRERKLLVADHDIRDLMGARNLHIVDTFDIDGKGKTKAPFGRVFYTEGKSLIFYAFDLKGGATFQAWGQREAKAESAQSLGIFYVDDQKQNRWVLKFDNPKVLAEINAVFVTIEPPGGSVKPNRQKMLNAYLNANPNHP
ncbi:MAG TPA: hypothetical protein VNY05_23525 [Candidatus Acidoferrales bacterium]|jgi:hypothetical protein|nr:hypothetical protein [Candidatus Acidoferrales bacterium]